MKAKTKGRAVEAALWLGLFVATAFVTAVVLAILDVQLRLS